MFSHKIENSGFVIDDIEFRISGGDPETRPPSEPGKFTIVKGRGLLDVYGGLQKNTKARGILELGVFQGGSYVLLDKMFQPERMSAIDISTTPVVPLVDYCRNKPGRSVHFDTSQTDEARLHEIVAKDLNGELDFVIDDASHLYEQSRRSFEILFPLLADGGTYIIEDWIWSHTGPHQPPGSTWFSRPALTNLIFELTALQGSTNYIAEIRVFKPLVVVRKGRLNKPVPPTFMSEMNLRGRDFSPVL